MSRRAMEGQWTHIENGLLDELWTIYRVDVSLQACRGVLMARLFTGGIQFVDSKNGTVPDAAFLERVQRFFIPFARDILDAIIVQGFAAYFVDAKQGVPVCVPPGAAGYGVSVDKQYMRRKMGLFRDGGNEADPRALFVVENWPTAAGGPVSWISSFRKTHSFRAMVELNTAIADYTAARPLVYTSTDSDAAFDRKHVYRDAMQGVLGGAAATSFLKERGRAADISSLRDAHERSVELISGLNSASASLASDHRERIAREQQGRLAADISAGILDARAVRIDPASGLPVFDTSIQSKDDAYNVVPLPVDTKIQHTVVPNSRRDLVAICDFTAQCACMAMGIPASAIGLHSGRLAADAEMSNGVLRATLNRTCQLISSCLKDVYNMLYGDLEGLVVVLPSVQHTDVITNLFENNVITYDSYKRHIESVFSVSKLDFEPEDPRGQKEAKGGGRQAPAAAAPTQPSKTPSMTPVAATPMERSMSPVRRRRNRSPSRETERGRSRERDRSRSPK